MCFVEKTVNVKYHFIAISLTQHKKFEHIKIHVLTKFCVLCNSVFLAHSQ